MLHLQPPTFEGSKDGTEAKSFLLCLERCYGLYPYGSNLKAHFSIHLLQIFSSKCWDEGDIDMDTLTWDTFLQRFRERYLSEHYRQRKIDEFHDLQQRGLIVVQYEGKFLEILPYVD